MQPNLTMKSFIASFPTKCLPLVAYCLLQLCLSGAEKTLVSFQIPLTRKAEGMVRLEYVDAMGRTDKHELAFTEITDSETERSKVSIGYVSHEPRTYFGRGDTVISVNNDNVCELLKTDDFAPRFLPELDHFIRFTYTKNELEDELAKVRSYYLGPAGIVLMHMKKPFHFDHKETYRNLECSVHTSEYRRSKSRSPIYFDMLIPSLEIYEFLKMPFFSVRERVSAVSSSDGGPKFDAIITIDYFYIEPYDKKDPHQLDQLESELNLPFAKGCSEFLLATRPTTNSQSFTMAYIQKSASEFTSLAYDHDFNYLRKEQMGSNVAVWDLNEDLLYHVDNSLSFSLQSYNAPIKEIVRPCSVLSPENVEEFSSAPGSGEKSAKVQRQKHHLTRPYKQAGSSLNVLAFLGAETIFYMGQSTVRDLPCLVFETILSEPPKIFQTDIRLNTEEEINSDGFDDYIVQFYIFKTIKRGGSKKREPNSHIPLVGNQFWPARINLYARRKMSSSRIHLMDSLDIQDFHWGLFGSQKKASELFMLPECFDDEDEQLRIDLALEFTQMSSEENQKLLKRSKYKLEMDLQSDLFKLFEISRLHLTEYELMLKKHNVLARLVVSDRAVDLRVTFFGEGELPESDLYAKNRIKLETAISTSRVEDCILAASHIENVALVVYCPSKTSKGRRLAPQTCTAVFSEPQPIIKETSANATDQSAPCQVYRFHRQKLQNEATRDLNRIKKLLDNHKFVFETQSEDNNDNRESSPKFEGLVQDFDVSREQQLIVIHHYKFVLPQEDETTSPLSSHESSGPSSEGSASNIPLVRHYDSIQYNIVNDCAQMCDMDAHCRSFAYCQAMSDHNTIKNELGSDATETMLDKTKGQCLLSSLDLTSNNVESQLVHSTLNSANHVIVKDWQLAERKDPRADYKLKLKVGCNIHERNPLTAFSETNEYLRIDRKLAEQFITAPSVSKCARMILSFESSFYAGSTFAYCSHTSTCLTDENLFGASKYTMATSATLSLDEDSLTVSNSTNFAQNEVSCQMYRRRYQNYFNMSPYVLKRASELSSASESNNNNNIFEQTELNLNSVEDCARACWINYGHVCLSFDYCSLSRLCLINAPSFSMEIAVNALKLTAQKDSNLYETRPGCIAYVRDLKWDHVRRKHLVGGRHKLLEMANDLGERQESGGFASLFINFALLCAGAGLFVAGLNAGRIVNEQLEDFGIFHRSFSSANSSMRDNFSNFNDQSKPSDSFGSTQNEGNSSNAKFNIENEIYGDTNAIRLEEFGCNQQASTLTSVSSSEAGSQCQDRDASVDELISGVSSSSTSARDSDVVPSNEWLKNQTNNITTSAKRKATRRTPNYIDVPDLL